MNFHLMSNFFEIDFTIKTNEKNHDVSTSLRSFSSVSKKDIIMTSKRSKSRDFYR